VTSGESSAGDRERGSAGGGQATGPVRSTLWLNIIPHSERVYGFTVTCSRRGIVVPNEKVQLAEPQYHNLHETLRQLTDPEASGNEEAFAQFGRILYRTVLPDPVQELLHHHLGPIVFATEELSLPWELLHDGNEYLCLTRPFARQPETYQMAGLLFGGIERARADSPVQRILILADTTGDLPEAADEAVAIKSLYEEHGAVCDTLVGPGECTYLNILGKLTETSYHVIHFSGHARYLLRSDTSGIPLANNQLLMAEDICRNLLGEPIVFLNACHSYAIHDSGASAPPTERAGPRNVRTLVQAFAHGNRSGRGRAVIGSMWWVDDNVARGIAEKFYAELLNGNTLGESLRLARSQIAGQVSDPALWSSYVLFGDPVTSLVHPPTPQSSRDDTPDVTRTCVADPATETDEAQPRGPDQTTVIGAVKTADYATFANAVEAGVEDSPEGMNLPDLTTPAHAQLAELAGGVPWSDDVRVALLGALATMYAMNWSMFSTIHLVIGLTYLPDGLISRAFKSRGLDPTIARRELRRILTRTDVSKKQTSLVISDNMCSLLASTKQNALASGDDEVTERHLLQELLTLKDSGAVFLLEAFKIDIDQLRNQTGRTPGRAAPGVSLKDATDVLLDDGALNEAIFDHRCLAALEATVAMALRTNWPVVSSAHLFLGMLHRPESALAQRLREGKLASPTKLTALLVKAFTQQFDPAQQTPGLHEKCLSANALKILRTAHQLAVAADSSRIEEDHVLRAILDDEENLITKMLREMEIDPQRLVE